MNNTNVVHLVKAMRAQPELRAAVERFCASAPMSPEARADWSIICERVSTLKQRNLSGVDIARSLVYEAALDVGMRLHPARAKALEDAA